MAKAQSQLGVRYTVGNSLFALSPLLPFRLTPSNPHPPQIHPIHRRERRCWTLTRDEKPTPKNNVGIADLDAHRGRDFVVNKTSFRAIGPTTRAIVDIRLSGSGWRSRNMPQCFQLDYLVLS